MTRKNISNITAATLLALPLFLSACGAPVQQASPQTQVMQAADPDTSNRPEWTMNEPEIDDGNMFFVGLSAVHASEKAARNDAKRDAVNSVVAYLGTIAKNKFEEARVSFGLTSDVIDPTKGTRAFEKQLSANVANRMKAGKWYMERETGSSGNRGYKYFVLAKIPMTELDKSFQQTAAQNRDDAKQRAKNATTAQAKKQAEDAADFWANMEKQGISE